MVRRLAEPTAWVQDDVSFGDAGVESGLGAGGQTGRNIRYKVVVMPSLLVVHQDQTRAGLGGGYRDLRFGFQAPLVVDDGCSGGYGISGNYRLAGVHADRQVDAGNYGLQSRHQPLQFLFGGDGFMAGTGGLGSHIDKVGAFGLEP